MGVDPDYRTWLSTWRVDNFPFCPAGMPLLHNLALKRPDLYERARVYHFADFDDPEIARSPEAQALMRHRTLCADCDSC